MTGWVYGICGDPIGFICRELQDAAHRAGHIPDDRYRDRDPSLRTELMAVLAAGTVPPYLVENVKWLLSPARGRPNKLRGCRELLRRDPILATLGPNALAKQLGVNVRTANRIR